MRETGNSPNKIVNKKFWMVDIRQYSNILTSVATLPIWHIEGRKKATEQPETSKLLHYHSHIPL